MRRIYLFAIMCVCALCLVLCLTIPSIADDLEDKIGQYTDDDIQADHTMGEGTPNVKFIKQNAKSKAKVRQKAAQRNHQANTEASDKKKHQTNTEASGNMNSVVLGPGGSVKGDIIIIDESKGSKTQVVDK